MRFRPWLLSLVLASAVTATLPAHASFHFIKIVEVFPGTAAAPGAQYVVLQMYAAGQNLVGGHSVLVFNAAGTQVASFSFPGNVANGLNQDKLLIGTTSAATFFGLSVNLTMTAVIPLAGGRVCWDALDCVAWGNYTGTSVGVGTPFNATGGGLRSGRAMKRRLDISGGATTLEAADDTGDSANDFVFATPAPKNNARVTGTVPAATCGNAALEGLEACDDGNTTGGDGCRADCAGTEICGDGLVDPAAGETCDDGNTTDGDACPASCGIVPAAVPDEANPLGELRVERGAGTALDLTFAPACSATDHAVYWAVGPIVGALNWTSSACGLGIAGSAAFDPGEPLPGELLYFVVVGYNDTSEGTYGVDSSDVQRPEASGIGVCDRPVGETTCP